MNVRRPGIYTVLWLLLLLASQSGRAQGGIVEGLTNRINNFSNSGGASGGDSLKSRWKYEETTNVQVFFRDSTRSYGLDSSILDYTIRFPIPATHLFLGNTGSPTRSLLFDPRPVAGFDPGFHAYDAYKIPLEKIRFFNATKPFTELSYTLAGRGEQIIDILHTQNLKPYWNIGLQYRMINAPGTFRNQKSNHNNYLVTSWYQSPNKRYNNYAVFLLNSLEAGENGGIRNDKDYLNNPVYADDRYTIPTYLGGTPNYTNNFFSTNISTGNKYKETTLLLRQQYDFGRKDSVVTDSTVIPLFFPRLRFEHEFRYGSYRYNYVDQPSASLDAQNVPDSVYYDSVYQLRVRKDTGLNIVDRWREITNDFSVYQFPDANNLHQFIKVGIALQLLNGEVQTERSLHNLIGHGEYRNQSKNGKWDINASGKLYLSGYNVGDYHVYVSLLRLINPRVGSLQAGFENINRTPPFVFSPSSNFGVITRGPNFSKENTVHLFASLFQPKLQIQLRGDYYLITNYLYLKDFYKIQQESAPFNVLRISASKHFRFGRFLHLYSDLYLQQPTGAVEVNMPLFFTRQRFGYQGKLGTKKMNIAFGTELRYHTPYKADNYSPVLGQFFYQDSVRISNLPRIDLYSHLQIRNFRAFVRLENLNTVTFRDGLDFTNNNLVAPGYPNPGLIFRLGIYWGFVN